MRCYECNRVMKKKKGRHHYTESGLRDVYLEGVTIYYCDCGEEMAGIPRVTELHRCLARIIVEKSPHLDGSEIRFLRKNLGLKSVDFAKMLGVSKVTVSRWETGAVKIDKSYDQMIRGLVQSDQFRKLLAKMNTAKAKTAKSHRYVLDAQALPACAT